MSKNEDDELSTDEREGEERVRRGARADVVDERDDGERDDDERDEDDEGDVDEHERDDEEHDDDVHDAEPPPSGRRLAVSTLMFVAALLFVDAMANARYPLDEPGIWYFIVSADVAVILLNFAIMGILKTPVPRWMQVLVVVWLCLVRFLRFGDGIKGRYFAQRFNVYGDLALVPDGFRFLNSTWPWWQLVGGTILGLALLVGMVLLTYRAVGIIHGYLQHRRQTMIAGALIGLLYLFVRSSKHDARYDTYYSGGFAASALPRLEEEVVFLWNVKSKKGEYARLIDETEQMLAGLPTDLAKLKGANVYLILVESYGRAMFEWPPLATAARATFEAFEKDVTAHGFTLATGVLNSSTYGGQSWLAHNTIDTAIPTGSQLQYEIVYARKPRALASYFNDAGYRTVLVQPNTTRVAEGDFYAFKQKYYYTDFGYKGPDYAWATMPDQFVLDFVRRRELDTRKQPLFIQYVLVSSHAPWSHLPTIVEDWSRLGDGSIFNRTKTVRFPIEWPHFENATEAYGQSIIYDFELLRRYVTRFIDDGSLVIILGDHQPVAEVNGDSWEYGVPVHVLSKNPELVRPFVTRGYQPGIRPNLAGYVQGLETLMPNLLVDFSTERGAGQAPH
jgi:hypothetical protein